MTVEFKVVIDKHNVVSKIFKNGIQINNIVEFSHRITIDSNILSVLYVRNYNGRVSRYTKEYDNFNIEYYYEDDLLKNAKDGKFSWKRALCAEE